MVRFPGRDVKTLRLHDIDECRRNVLAFGWGDVRLDSCGCTAMCGDDGDVDGPGVCKGLPRAPEQPLVEVVVVPRNGVNLGPCCEPHPSGPGLRCELALGHKGPHAILTWGANSQASTDA